MPAQNKPEIPFNPEVLRWAREWAGHDINAAAIKAGVAPDKIVQWESGIARPTVRQARLLADLYGRPFLEFLQASVPPLKRPQLIPDFRLQRGTDTPADTRQFERLQAWAESQRENALALFEDIGDDPPTFPSSLQFSIDTDVEQSALSARAVLDFPIREQLAIRSENRDRIPTILRDKIEGVGVLTLKETGLRTLHARGFSIVKFPLPIIVFGSESPRAQAYTLVHEFAHLTLGISAISGPMTRRGGEPHVRAIERWCNRFAAAFLMPRSEFLQSVGQRPSRLRSVSDQLIRSLANRFSVSDHAALVRMVELGVVDEEFYWNVKWPEFVAFEQNYKGGGRARFYGSRYKNRLGRLYTNLVLQAWATGKITNHNAAEYMGIKNLQHLRDIRTEASI